MNEWASGAKVPEDRERNPGSFWFFRAHGSVDAFVTVPDRTSSVRGRTAGVEFAPSTLAGALRRRRWRLLARTVARLGIDVGDESVPAGALRVEAAVSALDGDGIVTLIEAGRSATQI